MSSEKFLMDSNSFIAPSREYYAFDIFPLFWDELLKAGEGRIVLLDKVESEILVGDDELSGWMRLNLGRFIRCGHDDEKIADVYSRVMDYLVNSGLYSDKARRMWDGNSSADPWLIAAAKAEGYTLVTFENGAGNLSKKQLCNKPKIPDIAMEFGVEICDLFSMMRALGIKVAK